METPEREKSQEQLVEEAGEIIHHNLVETGVADMVVSKSAHAQQPFSPDFYDGIAFEYGMRTDGVFITPRLSTSRNYQPVTLKLGRIAKTETEREKISEAIWSGVDSDHRRALIEAAIDHRIKEANGTIEDSRRLPEGMDPQSAKRWARDAKGQLGVLERLKTAFADGTAEEIIDSEFASLDVKIKK